MLYVDTCVLVAALTNEAETARMQTWLEEQAAGQVGISEWVATEFSAALSIKVRATQINPVDRSEAIAAFSRFVGRSFVVLPILASAFRVAARVADQFALGLRAGDALHLAVAANHGSTVVTLDKRLATAATALGVSPAPLDRRPAAATCTPSRPSPAPR